MKKFGVMLDMSRNAVMKPDSVKALVQTMFALDLPNCVGE